jgi:alanine racemase
LRLLLERDRVPGRPAPGIIAVVKANAYGHGATTVGLTLESTGVAMLACADIEEGVALREAGVKIPILVFGALSISHLDGVFSHGLTPTVSTPGAARALEKAAAARGVRLACHLKIDTGMNRVPPDNLKRTLPPCSPAQPRPRCRAQHFGTTSPATRCSRPSAAWSPARRSTTRRRPRLRHAGIRRAAGARVAFVRPGCCSGLVPPPHSTIDKPVMSLTSRVVAVRAAGRPAAVYGPPVTWLSPGYADGLDRRPEDRGFVIRGRRAPIVGAVSMDMLTADVTDIDAVGPGDEVVFLGSQGAEPQQTIDAREMASWIGTVPYEILCRLGARVERKYD